MYFKPFNKMGRLVSKQKVCCPPHHRQNLPAFPVQWASYGSVFTLGLLFNHVHKSQSMHTSVLHNMWLSCLAHLHWVDIGWCHLWASALAFVPLNRIKCFSSKSSTLLLGPIGLFGLVQSDEPCAQLYLNCQDKQVALHSWFGQSSAFLLFSRTVRNILSLISPLFSQADKRWQQQDLLFSFPSPSHEECW